MLTRTGPGSTTRTGSRFLNRTGEAQRLARATDRCSMRSVHLLIVASIIGVATTARAGIAVADWRSAKPDSIVDLRTNEGAALVKGQWRVHVAEIADVDHHAPGADLKP